MLQNESTPYYLKKQGYDYVTLNRMTNKINAEGQLMQFSRNNIFTKSFHNFHHYPDSFLIYL